MDICLSGQQAIMQASLNRTCLCSLSHGKLVLIFYAIGGILSIQVVVIFSSSSLALVFNCLYDVHYVYGPEVKIIYLLLLFQRLLSESRYLQFCG